MSAGTVRFDMMSATTLQVSERQFEEEVRIPGMVTRPTRRNPLIIPRHNSEDGEESDTNISVFSHTNSEYIPNSTTDSEDSLEVPILNVKKILVNDRLTCQFGIDGDRIPTWRLEVDSNPQPCVELCLGKICT